MLAGQLKRIFSVLKSDLRETHSLDEKRFIESARSYFSTEFEALQGVCPSATALKEIVSSGKLPDDSLRSHLFGCSKCFSTYRNLMKSRRWRALVVGPLPRLFQTPRLSFAPILCGLALVVAGAFLLLWKTGYRQASNNSHANSSFQIAGNGGFTSSQQSTVNLADGSRSGSTDRTVAPSISVGDHDGTQVRKRRAVPTSAVAVLVPIDLTHSTLLRETNQQEVVAARLVRGLNRLEVTLPIGSPSGAYRVSLVDAFGKEKKNAGAVSQDGKTLSVDLELSRVKPAAYRVCVFRLNEAPDCFPVVISAK